MLQYKVKKRDQGQAYLATLLDYAPGYNLALLSVQDKAFFQGLTPAVLGADALLRTPVIIAGCAVQFSFLVVLCSFLPPVYSYELKCFGCCALRADAEV